MGFAHLWPFNWSQCIRQVQSITEKPHHGCRTAVWPAPVPTASRTAGSWPPVSRYGPRLHRRAAEKTGATCQHLTHPGGLTTQPPNHPTTQPASQGQWALPHLGRPSIIDKVKCDEVLLRAHKEHTPFHPTMWPYNVLTLWRETFLTNMFWCLCLEGKASRSILGNVFLSNYWHYDEDTNRISNPINMHINTVKTGK